MLIKSPSGYAQQSPWLSIANKQLELMGRYMSELGLTPVARTRLVLELRNGIQPQPSIEFVTIYTDKNGDRVEKPLYQPRTASGTVHKISWQE